MHTFRTRFAKQIVAEYLPPRRATKKTKVIIFCDGMPSTPYKKDLLSFFARKGYWVFHPRYRGSWESDGKFLARSPHVDVIDVIDGLFSGFKDAFTGNKHKLQPDFIAVIGGSFGGPAALLSSIDKRVDKVVAIAAVVDWKKLGPAETFPFMTRFVPEAFGHGYRMSWKGWKKLSQGKLYNPVKYRDKLIGKKIFFIHAEDDDVAPLTPVKQLTLAIDAHTFYLKRGGHLSSMIVMKPNVYKKIKKFFS
jgi:dipeptidyl aminopeptidase/acylaminoacyl peptidase